MSCTFVLNRNHPKQSPQQYLTPTFHYTITSQSLAILPFVSIEEIPCPLINLKVHYRVRNIPPQDTILNKKNTTEYLRSILILFYLRQRLLSGVYPESFLAEDCIGIKFSLWALHVCPSYPLVLTALIVFGEECEL